MLVSLFLWEVRTFACHDCLPKYHTSSPPPPIPNLKILVLPLCMNIEDIPTTVKPHYNEVLGTMKITLLYQVSHYIRVKKQRNIKSWDQQNYLVTKGFCYIRPLYNEVPLYL